MSVRSPWKVVNLDKGNTSISVVFQEQKTSFAEGLVLSEDIKWPSWLAGSTSSFPGESQCCCSAWQWAADHLPVGSKEMMVEARNDCYFSPADRYTSLAEMIQQFKVESCETCWVPHGEHRTQEGQLCWNTSGIYLFPSALNHRLMCGCRLFLLFSSHFTLPPRFPDYL